MTVNKVKAFIREIGEGYTQQINLINHRLAALEAFIKMSQKVEEVQKKGGGLPQKIKKCTIRYLDFFKK